MICFVEQLSTYKIVYSNMDESELQKFFVIGFFFLYILCIIEFGILDPAKVWFFFCQNFFIKSIFSGTIKAQN